VRKPPEVCFGGQGMNGFASKDMRIDKMVNEGGATALPRSRA